MQSERFKSTIIPLRQTLFRAALKWLQQKEEAEDVVQETMLRLWNIREQLPTISNPAAFAMQITKNSCIDRLKSRRENTEVNDFCLGAENETPYSEMEKNDVIGLVKQIIERLPESQKIVIRMRDIEGYELQEIAEIAGAEVSAVTVNLSRARKKVRERFIKIMNYKLGNDE
ncbi:MAG: sigma-70 family RNA polymerase sigma factor [Dysgonamonadaceae bacterium]|jgi:RNA polymerase sigma-70 factor (ECF subfamily)|nr:sigma-70 family RNA polymerase sigma factor [Dysgonamonadaceae bacterium]